MHYCLVLIFMSAVVSNLRVLCKISIPPALLVLFVLEFPHLLVGQNQCTRISTRNVIVNTARHLGKAFGAIVSYIA